VISPPKTGAGIASCVGPTTLESHTQGIVDERVRLVYERVLKPRA
jgi:hypothetical protein